MTQAVIIYAFLSFVFWNSFELSKSTLGLAFVLQRNLSNGTPLIKGHFHSEDKKFGPGKMFA